MSKQNKKSDIDWQQVIVNILVELLVGILLILIDRMI